MKTGVAAVYPSTPRTGALGTPALALACVLAVAVAVASSTAASAQSSGQSNLPDSPQPSQDREARSTPAATAPPPEPATAAPPRSGTNQPDSNPSSGGGERNVRRTPEQSSSSEQERGDISPPREDELAHPDAGGAHHWNPLRAMKDVEVGTYYYKAGNYKAAISRFREALEFKPRDADATFKLAQALEKNGELDEARTQYEAYLTILTDGPEAGEAGKALERLKKR